MVEADQANHHLKEVLTQVPALGFPVSGDKSLLDMNVSEQGWKLSCPRLLNHQKHTSAKSEALFYYQRELPIHAYASHSYSHEMAAYF